MAKRKAGGAAALAQQLHQPVPRIGPVAVLRAEALRLDHHPRRPASSAARRAAPARRRIASVSAGDCRASNRNSTAVANLVDVLPARPGGGDEPLHELGLVQHNAGGDPQEGHGGATRHAWRRFAKGGGRPGMLGPMDVQDRPHGLPSARHSRSAPARARRARRRRYTASKPPIGSAFIRVVNATAAPLSIAMDDFGAMQLGAGQGDRVAPFRVVEDAAKHPVHVTAEAGWRGCDPDLPRPRRTAPSPSWWSRARAGGWSCGRWSTRWSSTRFARAWRSTTQRRVARARPVWRRSRPARTVFDNVAAGTTKSRTVNPVQATLRAQCGGQSSPDLALAGMAIGSVVQHLADAARQRAPVVPDEGCGRAL